MTTNSLPSILGNQHTVKPNFPEPSLQALQESLYNFLIQLVNIYPPEEALKEFKQLFIHCLESGNFSAVPVIQKMVMFDNEEEFRYTLKRSCYILINNWAAKRKHKYIHELINLFTQLPVNNLLIYSCPELITYQVWLEKFVHSQDYQELKKFNYTNTSKSQTHWSDRYANYLLVAQSVDPDKPQEQQEAASKLSRQMKDKYKFELAMYIARSQSTASSPTRYHNPSIFGDEVLRLIKMIVVKKGKFSYENIAHIFLKQTENQTLKQFKQSIHKYLFFSVGNQAIAEIISQILTEKLSLWKVEKDEVSLSKDLLLRVCNRLIDFLTTENRQEPSELFTLLLSHGHPLTLVVILLKIICICKSSRSHLESRIADLINFYKDKSEDECKWLIQFIEFYNITFAIYAENVEYNLLKMVEDEASGNSHTNLDTYRVFSQVKADANIPD
ncbi:hypothetical protein [Nostoc parmelioides]|uniref:Uncharacterized protein n=1 Tax=Nostoc parmelioides FACHB-3921 TaxID=2692909 RepID=A0ABR8BB91_9NOSO|nr:hypothetical protein [Nostoc parmelioides]MBD2251116.1 hypothetical protein [Nostoc parmelioides FACHB-3921]